MSSKLVKKLQKDLKKSPGKAAVLALLLVVALWFWAPLLTNLFANGNAKPATSASTSNVANDSASTGTPTPTQPLYTWKQIADAIDADSRMKPTEPMALARDPFHRIEKEQPQEEPGEVVALPPEIPDVSPGDAGLVLNSTILGTRRQVARINGKSYRKGERIVAAMGDQPLEYEVVQIGPRSVALVLGDREYELKMQKSTAAANSAALSTTGSGDAGDVDALLRELQQ